MSNPHQNLTGQKVREGERKEGAKENVRKEEGSKEVDRDICQRMILSILLDAVYLRVRTILY
jgi:hypothetical protein